MATTEPLSEPALPVSPQTAGPPVPERGIGPGGVSGCSAMPESEKVQPARQSWRFQGGQDTIERHGGLDVVMEKIVQWQQAIPSRERETRAAGVMGPGERSPGRGFEGAEPLASPNVIHWVGWLPFTTRCGAGLAAPPRTARRLRLSTCPATGIAPKIRSLLFRRTRPHGGSRSRTARSSRNLLLSSKAVEATAMVSSRDRLSQGPGSGQVTDSADTYGRHRMSLDRMGRPWKRPNEARSMGAGKPGA